MGCLLHVVILLAASVSAVTATTGYIDHLPGTLNMILSAPHGGRLRPSRIPVRDYGCYIRRKCVWSHTCGNKDKKRCRTKNLADLNTDKLTLLLRKQIFTLTGAYPHVVFNKLHRSRLDANRERSEAAFNVPLAKQAWSEYQGYLRSIRANITRGIVFDIHGYGRTENYILLGYLISKKGLEEKSPSFAHRTSIRALIARKGAISTFRGNTSLGAFLEKLRYSAVPSNQTPLPCGKTYDSGGYITKMYGSRYGGGVDAIQIESPKVFRDTNMLEEYAVALGEALTSFYNLHYT